VSAERPEFPCGHWTREAGRRAVVCERPSSHFYVSRESEQVGPRARCGEHQTDLDLWTSWREASYEEALVRAVMVK
jgi:hypothetical protein